MSNLKKFLTNAKVLACLFVLFILLSFGATVFSTIFKVLGIGAAIGAVAIYLWNKIKGAETP
jgi:hypothetical protein